MFRTDKMAVCRALAHLSQALECDKETRPFELA